MSLPYQIDQTNAYDVGHIDHYVIPTSKYYPYGKDKDHKVPTKDEAIANIKGVIDEGHGVVWSMQLPTNAAWTAFSNFWDGLTKDEMWDMDKWCGEKIGSGDGWHDILILGYEDDGTDEGSYWTVLNSWGNARNTIIQDEKVVVARPDGTFKLPMRKLDYNCAYYTEDKKTKKKTYQGAMEFQHIIARDRPVKKPE